MIYKQNSNLEPDKVIDIEESAHSDRILPIVFFRNLPITGIFIT